MNKQKISLKIKNIFTILLSFIILSAVLYNVIVFNNFPSSDCLNCTQASPFPANNDTQFSFETVDINSYKVSFFNSTAARTAITFSFFIRSNSSFIFNETVVTDFYGRTEWFLDYTFYSIEYLCNVSFLSFTYSYFFTPHSANEIDYFSEVEGDAVDFSDGTTHSFLSSNVNLNNAGYGTMIANTTSTGTSRYFATPSNLLIHNDYDTLVIRYRVINYYYDIMTLRVIMYDSPYTSAGRSYYKELDKDGNWHNLTVNNFVSSAEYSDRIRFFFMNQTSLGIMYAHINDCIETDYIRLIKKEEPILTDYGHYVSLNSSQNYLYRVYQNGEDKGFFNDLEEIEKKNEVGTHNITYIVIQNNYSKVTIAKKYEYIYTVTAADIEYTGLLKILRDPKSYIIAIIIIVVLATTFYYVTRRGAI